MSHAPAELIIEAGHTERNYWRDLFRYRELFYFLAWRDVLVRYKQTVIGILWAVLRPLLTMVVFTFVFSRSAKLPSDGVGNAVARKLGDAAEDEGKDDHREQRAQDGPQDPDDGLFVAHEDVAPGEEVEEFAVAEKIAPVIPFGVTGLDN